MYSMCYLYDRWVKLSNMGLNICSVSEKIKQYRFQYVFYFQFEDPGRAQFIYFKLI